MATTEFSDIVATLLLNGFHIKQVDRLSSGNTIVHTYKYDKLGAEIRYAILFSQETSETPVIETLSKRAKTFLSTPVLVCDNVKNDTVKSYTYKEFFNFFGGIVNTGLISISNLPEVLDQLGHNKLPADLAGTPEDLLELYSAECLQYIFESPTRRYGSDRLFEKLPDGLVLSKNKFMVMFDAKAYSNGFDIGSPTINSLAHYVKDFNERYGIFFGSIFTVIIISGTFNDSTKSISSRSEELYGLCNCKISTVTAKELGVIVQSLRQHPELKVSINWKNVFVNAIVTKQHVETEIKRIQKDKVH